MRYPQEFKVGQSVRLTNGKLFLIERVTDRHVYLEGQLVAFGKKWLRKQLIAPIAPKWHLVRNLTCIKEINSLD